MLSLQLFATKRGTASRADVLADVIAATVLAEEAGFDTVWLAEHHDTDWNLCSDPLTLLATLAARTTRIRLGAAVVNLALHHPVRIAEQAAVVNALSRGRLELGLGKGFAVADSHRFDLDPQATERIFRDKHERLCELLRSDPDTATTPTWLASSGNPRAVQVAIDYGHGLLLAATGHKLAAIVACAAAQDAPPRLGLVRVIHTGPTAAAAEQELRPYLEWYIGAMNTLQPTVTSPTTEEVLSTFCLVGTAGECLDRVDGLRRTYQLSEVIGVPGIGGMNRKITRRVLGDLGATLDDRSGVPSAGVPRVR